MWRASGGRKLRVMKTSSRAATLALIVLGALAGSARAEVTPAGSGEPAFTRRAWRLSSRPSSLPLLATAAAPGRARFTLVRGGRAVARGTLVIVRAGQTGFRLALPRGVRPGAYRL